MEEINYRQDTEDALAFSRCQNRFYDDQKKKQLNNKQSVHRNSGKREQRNSDVSSLRDRKQKTNLKKILTKIKVNRSIISFCSKLKRNLVTQIDQDLTIDDTTSQNQGISQFFKNKKGIALSGIQTTVLCLLSILSITFLVITSSLNLAFEESQLNGGLFYTIYSFALLSFVLEICLNFVTKRYEQGRALVFIQQISINYLKSNFLNDFINIIVIILQLSESSPTAYTKVLRWVILLKIPELFDKFQILQNLYITTFTREQYCGLFFVLLTNFTLAHFLSILLNLMANFSDSQNWLIVKNIQNLPWNQRYIWGYYWGTTIMLTVGFGDIAATNSEEALCLIFIEMVSCISLAYNINCVGNLIGDLRKQSKQKSNNLKTFQLMAKSNKISLDLENRINNYIQESFLIKNQFNFQEQNALLSALPEGLNRDYLKEVNGKQLRHLPFFKDLTKKSQFLLAQHIIRKITHPQEVILSRGDVEKLLIIQKGVLGLVFGTKKSSNTTQVLSVKKNQDSKLLSLGMIRSNRADYTVKSLTYSVIHTLQNENFSNILRQDKMSYEYYCMMRDMPYTDINQDEIIPCQSCIGVMHIKSKCPKFHYLPIREIIVFKGLKNLNDVVQCRKKIRRVKNLKMTAERSFKRNKTISYSVFEQKSNRTIITVLTQDNLTIPQPEKTHPVEIQVHSFEWAWKQYTQQLQQQQQIKDFWPVEADLMYNWKYYFTNANPANLIGSRLCLKASRKNHVSSFK